MGADACRVLALYWCPLSGHLRGRVGGPWGPGASAGLALWTVTGQRCGGAFGAEVPGSRGPGSRTSPCDGLRSGLRGGPGQLG